MRIRSTIKNELTRVDSDDTKFVFSTSQLRDLDVWARETPEPISEGESSGREPGSSHDLVQHSVEDCSVVASLSAVTARKDRGQGDIFKSSFFPYDEQQCVPASSQNGKYIFRFYFNGCYRKVMVDDLLPTSKTSKSLHVVDRNDPNRRWPALLEKAYLKVRGVADGNTFLGSYDFPGSNSGTDLWIMTGWIPEQVFLDNNDVDHDALWQRINSSFTYGDVLITMGTGKFSAREEKSTGLIGEHDYAVLDIRMFEDQKCFLLKNPWANGLTWKGHVRSILELRSLSLNAGQTVDKLRPGTFWIPLTDVLQHFQSIYLNWNPGLFSHREDTHFTWDKPDPQTPEGFLGTYPQYNIRSEKSGLVWILLSRHMRHEKRVGGSTPEPGFMSLSAFTSQGRRIFLSKTPKARSPVIDSHTSLLKLETKSTDVLTIVISMEPPPPTTQTFTLSALSTHPVILVATKEPYTHTVIQTGAWTAANSGGNANHPNHESNPQYKLTLMQTSDVSLYLQNPVEKWPVHVSMVWANGKQVKSLSVRDIVGHSGLYNKGLAFAEIRAASAGTYTIICSTFERGQTGDFTLRVGSSAACQIGPVTVASAGRFITEAPPICCAPGENRWVALLQTPRLNRVSVIASSHEHAAPSSIPSPSPLKVSLELGKGPDKEVLGVSGDDDFADARQSGISIPDLDIAPGMSAQGLWVVVERIGCSAMPTREAIDVRILSEGPCSIGRWTPRDEI